MLASAAIVAGACLVIVGAHRAPAAAVSRDTLASTFDSGIRNLVADLVTARPDAGPDDRGDLPAERRDARVEDSVDQPEPSGVQQRESGTAVRSR